MVKEPESKMRVRSSRGDSEAVKVMEAVGVVPGDWKAKPVSSGEVGVSSRFKRDAIHASRRRAVARWFWPAVMEMDWRRGSRELRAGFSKAAAMALRR